MRTLIKSTILVIILLLIQTGQANSQANEERILQLTKEITEAEDFEIGLKKSNELIKLSPNSGSSYATRGIVYFKADKFSETIEDVDKALLLGVSENLAPIIRNLRGLSHFKLENFKLAITDFTFGIDTGVKDHRVYLLRSIAYRQIGETELAIKDEQMSEKLKRVSDSNVKTEEVLEDDELGKLLNESGRYFDQGNYEQAIKGFTKIIDFVGDDENIYAIYFSRGRSYFELKNYDAAMADYNMTIKLRPDMPDAYTFRGEIYSKQEKYDLAIIEFGKALKIKPDEVLALARRGEVYLAEKKYNKAISDFDMVLKLDAEFYSAWFWRAESHFGNNEYKSALRDISQFIKLQDNVAEAYDFRAKVLRKLGRNKEAERDNKKFRQLSSGNN